MRRGLIIAGLIGLMLGAIPAAQAAPLHGTVSVSVLGGRVRGYSAGLSAVFISRGQDSLTFGLGKTTGKITQENEWSIPLPARDVTINRAKASIKVNDPIGPGGSYGELDFTFAGLRSARAFPARGRSTTWSRARSQARSGSGPATASFRRSPSGA